MAASSSTWRPGCPSIDSKWPLVTRLLGLGQLWLDSMAGDGAARRVAAGRHRSLFGRFYGARHGIVPDRNRAAGRLRASVLAVVALCPLLFRQSGRAHLARTQRRAGGDPAAPRRRGFLVSPPPGSWLEISPGPAAPRAPGGAPDPLDNRQPRSCALGAEGGSAGAVAGAQPVLWRGRGRRGL